MTELNTYFQQGAITAVSMALSWLLPFFSFLLLIASPSHFKKSGSIASALVGLSFAGSLLCLFTLSQVGDLHIYHPWFRVGSLDIEFSIFFSKEAAMLFAVVNLISFLVHLFSMEYMKNDERIARYFAYLGLFTFAMGGIVLLNNLLMVFIFWEMVGFASYLLIGFWRHKPSAAAAAKKAFIMNRIGDAGFLIAIMIIAAKVGHFDMEVLNFLEDTHPIKQDAFWHIIAGLGIFAGVMGKSAQFPLMTWLPDAMEGPTPVSALIHAATMVAAGVYLLSRMFGFFATDVMIVIAIVGCMTAFMGAVAALAQRDIKKVLAFSTVSQLGYMVMAMGVGAYQAGFFHLITHAFFKAGLFLSAGAVIHYMHALSHQHRLNINEQDMHRMGGLRHYMPFTFWAFTVCMMALIGLPFFTGFLSKDAILIGTVNWAGVHGGIFWIIPYVGLITVLITAFYMGRQWFWVFFGRNNLVAEGLLTAQQMKVQSEGNWQIKFPLAILGAFSIFPLISLNPFDTAAAWVYQWADGFADIQGNAPHLLITLVSVGLALFGLSFAYLLYGNKRWDILQTKKSAWVQLVKLFSLHNWFLDSLYDGLIRRPVMYTSRLFYGIDKKVIDGFIRYLALIHVINVHILGWIDKYLVDGVVRLSGNTALYVGSKLKGLQSGSIQAYLIFSLLVLMFIMIRMVF